MKPSASEPGRGAVLLRGLGGIVAAVVVNVAFWWLGMALLPISSDFPPLAGPQPTIFFTAVGGLGALIVFAVLRVVTASPTKVFRGTALAVLLFSFVPDLWLLSGGAEEAFPGATPAGVALLMLMHLSTAIILVWALTGSPGPGGR